MLYNFIRYCTLPLCIWLIFFPVIEYASEAYGVFSIEWFLTTAGISIPCICLALCLLNLDQ
jgi:hypothetical protein